MGFVAVVTRLVMPDEKPKDAGAPEIEITPEMIEAGVQTYYEYVDDRWNSPGGDELMDVLAKIYAEMAKCAPKHSSLSESV